jgi:hypothetical protein
MGNCECCRSVGDCHWCKICDWWHSKAPFEVVAHTRPLTFHVTTVKLALDIVAVASSFVCLVILYGWQPAEPFVLNLSVA